MKKNTLRVGMIGTRFMGRAHASAFHQANRFFDLPRPVELAAVAGQDVLKTKEFADRWDISTAHACWQDLVEDDSLDLIDIATPNFLHGDMALAALKAGRHVVCEKPLAADLAGARAMAKAARGARGRTFVWFNYRRCPAVALAHQWIKKGRIGVIRHIRAHYLQSWGGPQTPLLWRFKKKLAGSGAHGDLNAHIIDMARFLVGDEVKAVHGALARTFVTRRRHPERRGFGRSDVDDAFIFLATMKGGGTAVFEASRLAPGHLNDNHIEVNGEKGSLRFSFEDMNVLEFFDATLPSSEQGWRRIVCTDQEHHPWADAWWPDAHLIGYEHTFTNQVADMVKVLCRRRPVVPLADFEDAFQTQRVLAAAELAATQGRSVSMGSVK